MINQHLHREPVALDSRLHRDLKLDVRVTDWSIASRLNALFVATAEFPDVCRDFPIVFVRVGKEADGRDEVAPIAVLGLVDGQNLYLDGGKWLARYIPAVLRCYPFCIGRMDPERVAVCVDMAFGGIGQPEGQALFQADGAPTQLLKDMRQHLELMEAEIQRTRLIGRRLLELDLLHDMRFDATLPDGHLHRVDGFLTVDQDKAQNLPDNVLGELHRNGILGLMQLHWVSLGNVRQLVDRHVERNASTASSN